LSVLHRHLLRQLRKSNLSPEVPPTAPEPWQRLLSSVSYSYEAIDQERYLVEHSIKLASEEMRELNVRLAAERDNLERIVQVAPTGMAVLTAEGIVRNINYALEQMLGYDRSEVINRPAWDFLAPQDREITKARLQALATGQRLNPPTRRLHLVSKSGKEVLANLGAAPITDESAAPSTFVVVIEDITEKERLEIERHHAQKMESVGRLASGIAHEINTPIQFVGDNVNFLSSAFDDLVQLCDVYHERLHRPDGSLSPADREALCQAEEQADLEYLREHVHKAIASTLDGAARVSRIVKSMKSFAHPGTSERQDADINGALCDTLTVATNELKYVAVVETELGDIPPVPCFLNDLSQVFLNLFINAAHAIADVVGQSGTRGTIRVRTYKDGGDVVIAISDTGSGIPAAIRHRIFEPFFTTKEVGRGTGQGLALARSVVVDQHGGSILFDTKEGKGTTFFIRIPLVPAVSPNRKIAPHAQSRTTAEIESGHEDEVG
jgi:PAS domain S-box-containing protein